MCSICTNYRLHTSCHILKLSSYFCQITFLLIDSNLLCIFIFCLSPMAIASLSSLFMLINNLKCGIMNHSKLFFLIFFLDFVATRAPKRNEIDGMYVIYYKTLNSIMAMINNISQLLHSRLQMCKFIAVC